MRGTFFILFFFCTYSTYAQINCNNWLNTPSKPSYVDIGKLNVTGNQITVEAVINRTTPYAYGTGDGTEGDIVSKHDSPSDVNYLLRPNHAAITTNNGYFVTPDIADIDLNQTYHIAMVYDGTSLKFYRDGCLMSQVAATGNLFQNSWDTRIGWYQNQIWNTNFIGYINEVRIWNVARTQVEIKTYMNSSLPNPTTQPGLLAYYTFDNLINKQGNPSWNGTSGGSATINNTNPKCNPIMDLCNAIPASCNNWLKTPSVPSYVKIGQLNIPGNKVTIEALINRTAPYSGGQVWAGDIVSKHRDPTDANYILRPNSGEITTTNGYYKTPDIADINLNQTYHVAMVYDGDTLKFYRDGCLMSEIKATGNLIQNSWETSIGFYSPQLFPNENFIGYINEVRIWNVARTQTEIQTYMNSSLPNPSTQPGLLAYYNFYNLINKQGNAAWNGTLGGSASINQTNPNCNAIINNCPVPPPVCNILITKNADTTVCAASPVNMFAAGGTSFSWSPAAGLSDPNSANPIATPLTSTKYYVTVSDATGCSKLDSVTINVNALPVISKSNDTGICVNAHVPLFASGGTSYLWSPSAGLSNPNSASPVATPLTSTRYYVTVTNATGCSKKDSVNITVNTLPVISKSNDTTICMNSQAMPFAAGGTSYAWSPTVGLSNPNSASPVATPLTTTKYYVIVSNGGCAKEDSVNITVNSLPVITKSNDTSVCINSLVPLFASGGTAYSWLPSTGLDNSIIANPTATAKASTTYYVAVKNAAGCIKLDSVRIKVNNLPVISKSTDTSICTNSTASLFATGGSSYTWSPSTGLSNPNISKPVASPLASTKYYVTVTTAAGCSKSDSVKIIVNSLPVIFKSNDTTICKNTQAQFVASGGISYVWSPASSLNNATTSNPIAKPITNTIYNVTVTDVNGCTKTASVNVNIKPVPAITKSKDSLICGKTSVKIFATGGNSYSWSPVATLNNPTSATPVASPSATTMYHVQITDAQSCTYNDSVKISVRPPAVFAVSANQQICEKTNQQLNASGGDTYTWTPASFLDNPNTNNPIASPEQTTIYSVTIRENTCNEAATLVTTLTVLPMPTVHASKSNDITCTKPFAHLTALGAQDYSWMPTEGLDNANIANPVASPQNSTVYILTGKDQNGCINTDSISVSVDYDKNTFYGLPNSFTPNSDGLNDCFGVTQWGQVSELDFSIYNRFGQRVFYTHNATECWDGTFKGKLQDPSVFVYVVKAKTACGNIERKGTVTLLR